MSASPARRVPEQDAVMVAATLRRAFREAQLRMSRALAECGLSEQRYHLLLEVASAGTEGAAQAALAGDLRCPKTRISLLVRELEAGGMVEAVREAPDRRQVRVKATPAGRMVLEHAVRTQRQALASLVAGLAPETVTGMLETALGDYLGIETRVWVRERRSARRAPLRP